MRRSKTVIKALSALLLCTVATGVAATDIPAGNGGGGHPKEISVNGRSYAWPSAPIVVVCIDGGEPAYIDAAPGQGHPPQHEAIHGSGFSTIARGAMPSFTNPNNMSIVTGLPPSGHGISGNFFLNPATGKEVMMNEPEFLRAPSFWQNSRGRGQRWWPSRRRTNSAGCSPTGS